MPRTGCAPAVAVVIALLAGFASARLGDPHFAVTSVALAGPATIPDGQSRPYTVTLTIRRIAGSAQDTTIAGAQAPVGRIRPGLFAGDTRLTFAEIDFARIESSKTLQLSLSCSDNEVRGDQNGSGAGARAGSSGALGLPWWDRPARIRAKLDERESNELSVLCGG
jgi:hypothetical protein